MKSINLFNVGSFSNVQKTSAKANQKSLLQQEVKDTFVKSPNFTGKIDVSKALKKGYEALSSIEKEAIKEDMGAIYEAVEDCVNSTKLIADSYNEKYGKGNWEYISIGRSCAPFASILDKLGIKTHTIPISGMQQGVTSAKDLTSQKGFEEYKNFIYNLGLNPQTVKNSGKTYIFQDYVDQGNTIRIFEELIRSKEMGLDSKNIKFESINDALFNGAYSTRNMDNFRLMGKVMDRLKMQNSPLSVKNFTDVPKLHWSDLGKITTLTPADGNLKKEFDFGVADILSNGI